MAMRDMRPLVWAWVLTLAGLAVWWWAIHRLTVWAELLKPTLPLIVLPALWRTWHWFHARRRDRRDHDRRMASRRGER